MMRVLLFVLAASLSACLSEESQGTHIYLTFIKRESGERTPVFRVEVASTPAERHRGLAFRSDLGASEGMLLVYPRPSDYLVSNVNVPIPIDAVFVSRAATVVGILTNIPPQNDMPRSIGGPSQFIVLLPAGTVSTIGLGLNDGAVIQGTLPTPS